MCCISITVILVLVNFLMSTKKLLLFKNDCSRATKAGRTLPTAGILKNNERVVVVWLNIKTLHNISLCNINLVHWPTRALHTMFNNYVSRMCSSRGNVARGKSANSCNTLGYVLVCVVRNRARTEKYRTLYSYIFIQTVLNRNQLLLCYLSTVPHF